MKPTESKAYHSSRPWRGRPFAGQPHWGWRAARRLTYPQVKTCGYLRLGPFGALDQTVSWSLWANKPRPSAASEKSGRRGRRVEYQELTATVGWQAGMSRHPLNPFLCSFTQGTKQGTSGGKGHFPTPKFQEQSGNVYENKGWVQKVGELRSRGAEKWKTKSWPQASCCGRRVGGWLSRLFDFWTSQLFD